MFSRFLCKNVKYFEATKCNAAAAIYAKVNEVYSRSICDKTKNKET